MKDITEKMFGVCTSQDQNSGGYAQTLAMSRVCYLVVVLDAVRKGSELRKLARRSRYCLRPEALPLSSPEEDCHD